MRVIQFGLGAIGRAAARLCLERHDLQLVGAIDAHPDLAGQDLGRALGLRKPLGIAISPAAEPLLRRPRADAVIHCTTSKFAVAQGEFAAIARAGLPCVSSCEESLFPAQRHPRLTHQLDRLCRQHGVAMVGTGVNPGFVMDTLPVLLTAVCQRVERVRVRRVVDAGSRREALQRKVGAGLTVAEFNARAATGALGHVGLLESLWFVADALGWKLSRSVAAIEPAIASRRLKTEYLDIRKGQATGIQQIARGFRGAREALTLELQMYVGAAAPQDLIEIDGEPPLKLVIDGGTPGDIATPAILVNCLPLLMQAAPGWHTMKTVGLPRCQG